MRSDGEGMEWNEMNLFDPKCFILSVRIRNTSRIATVSRPNKFMVSHAPSPPEVERVTLIGPLRVSIA